jgi:hypothetical protein
MGLSIQVGLLSALLFDDEQDAADDLRNQFEACNRLLTRHHLPSHQEPESLGLLRGRADLDGFGYSSLHHLRLAYAHRLLNPNWTVTQSNRELRASLDPVLNAADKKKTSHLLWHSDAEGFYLPVNFKPLLIDKSVAGLVLCSTQRLIEELTFVAPAIGVRLQDGVLSDDEAAAINKRVDDETGPHIEQMVWITLYEAARLGLEHRAAIVFT